jgi:hypothetical protein
MTIMSMTAAIARSVIGAIGEPATVVPKATFCGATSARGSLEAVAGIDGCMGCISFWRRV